MNDLVIRDVVSDDISKLKIVVDTSGLFPSYMLAGMMQPYLEGRDDSIWLTAQSSNPTFVAYCAPEPMTTGTWNLYLIAVHSDLRSKGVGGMVLQYLEGRLRMKGERVLLVETSGLPEFEATRRFYINNGYTQEAKIRDFYEAGDDKIVFWKSLL